MWQHTATGEYIQHTIHHLIYQKYDFILSYVSSECKCQVDTKVWYVERVKKGINMQYQLLNVVKIADVCKVYSVVNTFGLAGILYLKYSQYIVRDMCCLLILSWPIHISEINSISSHIIIISYLLTLQLQLQKSPEIFKYQHPAVLVYQSFTASDHNMSSEWVWWVGGIPLQSPGQLQCCRWR